MATFNGKVTGGRLKLRTSPSTNASYPVQIPNGTSISVSTINDNQEWFSTSYNGHSGYVVAQYVAITADGDTCTVTTSSGSLNIRKKASSSANIMYTASKGSTLRLLDSTSVSGWYRVSNASGTGWGSSNYLTIGNNPGGGSINGNDYSTPATVDTTKNGTGGTLNMRVSASAGSKLVTTIPNGATIYVQDLSGEWLAAQYNGNTGYVMAKFVVGTNAYNGSSDSDDYPTPATVDTTKNGTGGALNMRASASTGSKLVTTIPNGATIYVQSLDGADEWLAAQYNGNTGYVMAKFVVGTNAYNGSTGGDSGTSSYTFNADNAVTYAMNHSDNSSDGACPKHNTIFTTVDGVNDCADFVSQCLCAGGVPMFDGWFYRLSGIPSSWKNSKWSNTYSGYQKLNEKGWLKTVSHDAIEPGDIIYTYVKDATPTPYVHVTIAVSGNVTEGEDLGCKVCGYTINQRDQFKKLTAENCRCYRIKETFTGNGSEKKVSLPLSGNGATVL